MENWLYLPRETDDGRHGKLIVGVPLKVARIKLIGKEITGQAVQHRAHLG